ncbi:MAG: DUF2934 domain-containing protein [Geminicoccaceae bacterium]
MLETTAKPGAAKPQDGRPKASKTTRTTARAAATRTATGEPAAPGRPKEGVQELIQRRAYELWEIEGRPAGREHVHWQQAELEITRAGSRRVGASR